jgi:signal transduction histidine kinase
MADRPTKGPGLFDSLRTYRFELRHLTVLLLVLVAFQLAVSFVHRRSVRDFLDGAQRWYQQDAAERLANLTTTSLELLLESHASRKMQDQPSERQFLQNFNIIFHQQLLHKDVREICLLIEQGGETFAVDDGHALYGVVFGKGRTPASADSAHAVALETYRGLRSSMRSEEQIRTIIEGEGIFHTFVPFVPRGEYLGAVYIKSAPDFSFVTHELISSYNQTTATYLALILIGLIAMFYVSSYTLRERNRAQQLLFEEQKVHLAEQIKYQHELMFTKRIYHTHHKAEKIMGFIKDDLQALSPQTMDVVKQRVTRYSNFVARVIYDMKWYDPPLQTVRSPLFRTDVNELIRFIVENIFLRVVRGGEGFQFLFELDDRVPPLHVNEYVIWEVLEPIIQNALDHAGTDNPIVSIRTTWDPATHTGTIQISDRGKGIAPWLLQPGEDGIKLLFREHVTTKPTESQRPSGYGCFLAYEIARQRCGWDLDAENLPDGGSRFTFTFTHQG